MKEKSSLEEIESRFDQDVERFSNLDTGQQTTLDAKLNMDLICEGISKVYPNLTSVLDIGCGAGNYDVNLLRYHSPLNMTLVDLSQPMLDRAKDRLTAINSGDVHLIKGDFRTADFADETFDVVIATAVLHHLRNDEDWENAFQKFYKILKPGGSIWIFDLIHQENKQLQDFIYLEKYGSYLTGLKDENYRDHVFSYIDKEDSPRSLIYQLNLLESVGFKQVDLLHKNLCFASFVGFKS